MNTELYEIVSYISFSISAVMCVCSIILFWKLDIGRIVGELTGRTAKKAIEELKERENVYSKSTSNIKRGLRYNELPVTEPLNITEKLMDAEIEDDTKLLEEFSSIPVKQENAGFQITKDEIYVHEEDATELLRE